MDAPDGGVPTGDDVHARMAVSLPVTNAFRGRDTKNCAEPMTLAVRSNADIVTADVITPKRFVTVHEMPVNTMGVRENAAVSVTAPPSSIAPDDSVRPRAAFGRKVDTPTLAVASYA